MQLSFNQNKANLHKDRKGRGVWGDAVCVWGGASSSAHLADARAGCKAGRRALMSELQEGRGRRGRNRSWQRFRWGHGEVECVCGGGGGGGVETSKI